MPTKHRQPDRWRVTLLFPRILLRGTQSIKIIKLAIFRPRLTPSQTAVKLRVPSATSSVAVVWPWIRWRACIRVCVSVCVDASVGGLLGGCKREFFFSDFLLMSWTSRCDLWSYFLLLRCITKLHGQQLLARRWLKVDSSRHFFPVHAGAVVYYRWKSTECEEIINCQASSQPLN